MDTSGGRGVSKLYTISCEFLVNLAKKWKIPCDLRPAPCVETDQLFQLTAVPCPGRGRLNTPLTRDSSLPGCVTLSLQVAGAGPGSLCVFMETAEPSLARMSH